MKYMTSNEIRKMWFKFFESKNHKKFESAPLVPINDDTLLWINAGVAPLKKYFDGSEVPSSKRIVNIQKCIVNKINKRVRIHPFIFCPDIFLHLLIQQV